jgi:hypothetical protein
MSQATILCIGVALVVADSVDENRTLVAQDGTDAASRAERIRRTESVKIALTASFWGVPFEPRG